MILLRVAKKFGKILSKHQKIRIIELGILMVIAGFMEMLSVSMMLPFVEAVMNPEKIMSNQYVLFLCNLMGIISHRQFIVILSVVMAIVYVLKNIFLLFQMTMQNRFVYGNLFITQKKLLRSFLLRPYESFLKIQSGEVLRIVGSDTVSAFGILTHMLNLVTELVVSMTLLVAIIVIAPEVTIGIGSLLLFLIGIIQFVTRPFLRRAGETHQLALAGMNKWMLQAVQGIKEIKLMKKESFFQRQFDREGQAYVASTYKQMTLGSVPKYMIEALTMGVFFVVVAFMFYRGAEAATLIPVLSSVAMAAIRLLPAVSRISGCMAGITFGEPAVDKMIENLKNIEQFDKEYRIGDNLDSCNQHIITAIKNEIILSEVKYKYPAGEKNILDNADMYIKRGSSVGVVGSSGEGKTTAIDILLGLLKPQNGKVIVDGIDISLDIDGWFSNIGYIPQTIFMLDGSIRENVAFGISTNEIDDEKVWNALQKAALYDYVKGIPEGLETQIGERGLRLSGGQRQRIGIARALYSDPEVLVFDEATSALDNDTEEAIMNSINSLQGTKTMIIVAHRLSTIDGCDVIYRVKNGKIVRER